MRDTGSRPVVGSSRKNTFGSCTRPRAISTRRRIPPDRFFTGSSAHCVSSTAASSSPISFRASRAARRTAWRRSSGSPRTVSSRSLVIASGITPRSRRVGLLRHVEAVGCADPDVGGSSVTSMRISVDLPAPLGPSSPKTSPASTLNETPSTAVKSPNFLTMLLTSMVRRSSGQLHVGRHAHRQAAILVVHFQPDLERLDVALGAADVALGRKAGVDAPEEHSPCTSSPEGRRMRHLVAHP